MSNKGRERRLGFLSDAQSGDPHFTILEETLDEKAFIEYRQVTKVVRDLSPMLSSYWTFQENYQELIETAHDILQFLAGPGGNIYTRENFAHEAKTRMSQRTSNVLASASALLKHSENYLANNLGKGSSRFAAWNELRKNLHAENFSYRFLYELRNFNQHTSIPISAVSAKGENLDDNERAMVSMTVTVSSRDLLKQNYEWKSNLRSELEDMPGDTDLLSEIDQYAGHMRQLFGVFLDQWIEELTYCSQYMDGVRLRVGAPEGSSVIYFESEPKREVNEQGGIQLRLEGMKFFPAEITRSMLELHRNLTEQH